MAHETEAMQAQDVRCHVCGASGRADVDSLKEGVTSDCQPWLEQVRVFCCGDCGAVQAPVDDAWRGQVDRIYRAYDTYAAAGGREQKVMSDGGARMDARSRVLVDWLRSLGILPGEGQLLDVGCGRGAFIEAFGGSNRAWRLRGTEFDDRNETVLRAIPGFEGLQTGRFEDIRGCYDVVSMLHVLEHIENPVQCLATLLGKVANGGLLLVQVPDWISNPFALAIADHATHFTPETLTYVARAAGWDPVMPVAQVVPKELTLLARASVPSRRELTIAAVGNKSLLDSRLAWLQSVREQASAVAGRSRVFGVFGTAVAGTWLAAACGGKVRFFVDEDPNRIGSSHLGLPVMAPEDVPAGADVFVGLAPVVADRLAAKYAGGPARFHRVPPLPQ